MCYQENGELACVSYMWHNTLHIRKGKTVVQINKLKDTVQFFCMQWDLDKMRCAIMRLEQILFVFHICGVGEKKKKKKKKKSPRRAKKPADE